MGACIPMGDLADQGSAAPVDGKADDQFRDRSYDSDDSTPEDIDIDQDQDPEQDNEAQGQASQQQQPPQQQKRKGGRKPVSTTSSPHSVPGVVFFEDAHLDLEPLRISTRTNVWIHSANATYQDLCDLRRAQAAQQAGASGLS